MDNLSEHISQKLINQAENGDIEAMVEVANYIVWDDESRPIDAEPLAKALDYLNKAAASDSDAAMLSLGAMYYAGRGVAQDFRKAVKWYTDAANRGNVTAMSNLGYCYYYGRSGPVDYAKAYQMFSKAALLDNDPAAYYKIGDMLMNGKFVDQDQVSAYRCYRTAYNIVCQDKPLAYYPDVCSRLGSCYHHGRGVKANLVKAEEMLSEAKIYFKERIKNGDKMTDGVYKRACDEWMEVTSKLDAENK